MFKQSKKAIKKFSKNLKLIADKKTTMLLGF